MRERERSFATGIFYEQDETTTGFRILHVSESESPGTTIFRRNHFRGCNSPHLAKMDRRELIITSREHVPKQRLKKKTTWQNELLSNTRLSSKAAAEAAFCTNKGWETNENKTGM